jgi:hypothetical protein
MDRERDIASPNREVILDVLSKAAHDHIFMARLAENPHKVLQEYNLTKEEIAVLARGDIEKLESWLGKLDDPLKTWINVRKAQEHRWK